MLNIGIVGAVGRGRSFKDACLESGVFAIHAVCDINEDALDQAQENLGACEKYTDMDTMLEKSAIQAIIIGTPMPYHVPQAIKALQKGIHVLSEVPAGVSLEECKQLVLECNRSDAVYMMAENYIYMKENTLITALVQAGLFGEPYYAEGEYLHELKELNEITHWRRKWQTGINGATYPTHSLGPILQWMPDDRVESVCCIGCGHHYTDPRGNLYENEDTTVMLCKTKKGALIKIRVDMLSDRPHAMTNYSLQGTDGAYESARSPGEIHKIWLRSKSNDPNTWMNLSELEETYLPIRWKEASNVAKQAGHGGGDYFEIIDFAESIQGKKPCPIGIHEAMDMTLPGLVSQQSILERGKWLPVPDSRDWH
jgi:predicted dehydrogenase